MIVQISPRPISHSPIIAVERIDDLAAGTQPATAAAAVVVDPTDPKSNVIKDSNAPADLSEDQIP